MGRKNASGATSVAEHYQDNSVVKAAARPETNEDFGPGVKKIATIQLKNSSLRFHSNTKGGTILGGMHRMVGPSGKTLLRQEMVEVVGS